MCIIQFAVSGTAYSGATDQYHRRMMKGNNAETNNYLEVGTQLINGNFQASVGSAYVRQQCAPKQCYIERTL